MGGSSVFHTELVTMEGGSKKDFSLSHKRMDHCSIQVRLDQRTSRDRFRDWDQSQSLSRSLLVPMIGFGPGLQKLVPVLF